MDERSRLWDLLMITLLLGSVALVFWYEALDESGHADLRAAIEWIDLGLVIFFVLEWGWRVRRAGQKYAITHAWELLGMIPLIIPMPAFLRALRVLRVVRILRVFGTIGDRLGTWNRISKAAHLRKIGAAAGAVTVGGALLVWALERGEGESLDSFPEALWWAIVTVTTVGYGDITPATAMGRFVATLLMVTGIGIVGALAASLASVLVVGDADEDTDDPDEAAGPEGSLVTELERLAALHGSGALTDAEFAAAKAKVLA